MPIYVAIALFGQVAQVLQDPIFFLLLLKEDCIHHGLYGVFCNHYSISPCFHPEFLITQNFVYPCILAFPSKGHTSFTIHEHGY